MKIKNPITLSFIAINLIVFICQTLAPTLTSQLYVYSGSSDKFEFYRIFTHIFTHVGIRHLLSNLVPFYFLSSYLESKFKGILKYGYTLAVVFAGINAFLLQDTITLHNNSNLPMLGFSGVVFFILAGYTVMKDWKGRVLRILLITSLVSAYFQITGDSSGVGTYAHIGGFVYGLFFFTYFKKKLL